MQSSHSLSVEERAFLLLDRTCALAQKKAADVLRRYGMTIAEYTLLRIVQNTPGITAGEARMRLFIAGASIAQVVAGLLSKGFLLRERSSDDTRQLHLFLTSDAKRQLKRAQTGIRSMLRSHAIPATLLHHLDRDLTLLLSSLSPHGEH